MAAITAVGVAASAAQLVVYGKGIISFLADVRDRVNNASQQYQSFELQLRLLVCIARGVEQNPALQTGDLKSHLDGTLVEVRSLQSILCSPAKRIANRSTVGRYWNLIHGAEQRKIFEYLDRLHKKNTGLLLSINTVNTTQLSSVQEAIDKLVDVYIKRGQQTYPEIEGCNVRDHLHL